MVKINYIFRPVNLVVFLYFLAFLLGVINCGEPLGAGEVAWAFVALFPENSGKPALAARELGTAREIYAAVTPYPHKAGSRELLGTSEARPKIYKFDGRNFVVDYEAPYEYNKAWFYDIAFFKEKGWAVGGKAAYRYGLPPFYPFIVYYDGVKWKEVDIKYSELGPFNEVVPIDENSCWLVNGEYGYIPSGGELVKFADGKFDTIKRFSYINDVAYAYDTKTTYVTTPTALGKTAIYVSPDAGNTWLKEEVTAPAPAGYFIQNVIKSFCAGANTLYLLANFSYEAAGIIKRTGAPGEGKYEVVFLSDTSPEFFGFNDALLDYSGRILAVGTETSVVFNDGIWLREKLPYPLSLSNVINAPLRGFFAVGDNLNFESRFELLYHP